MRDAGAAEPDAALVERFGNDINDDLNVPRALAVAWETLRGDLPAAVKRATLLVFDRVLRPRAGRVGAEGRSGPRCVRALADARSAARKAKNWAEADRLRGELAGTDGRWRTAPTAMR